MKILIKSRAAVEKMALTPFEEHTAIISITDANRSFAELKNKPEFLLQLAFDDVDDDLIADERDGRPTDEERRRLEAKHRMLSDEQAKQIAAFYHSHKDEAETLICQCEHGQSRSAAVAAAILEYRSRSGIKIFAHAKYYPNKAVFRKAFAALRSFHNGQNEV